jgi:murein DD-endopeptidase MepM/ murein hydrolase activator NlpD
LVVQVLRGDSVESVAERFNVSEETIIEANDLSAPYRLRPGQSLVLPSSASSSSVHIVSRGDTVASIARNYGVPASAIIDANGMSQPDALRVGERLTIPGGGRRQVARAERSERTDRIPQPVSRSDLAPPAREPVVGEDPRIAGGRFYTAGLPRPKPMELVGEGGPEFSDVRQVPVARDSSPARVVVADADDDDDDDDAYEPPQSARARERQVASDPADEAYSPRRARGRERQVASIDPDAAFDARRPAKPAAPTAQPKVNSRFVWPVRGQIISSFGKRASGVHNDGINIAAEPGSSVKAAESGVVVYAGNELAGYGNLLLIRHSNGFVTAYAHNKKLLVSKGDNVRRGETIALVGSTGDVDRPQLHFEIRKGDRAVDPGRYLESANASL